MTEYIRKEELKTFPSEVEQLIIKTDYLNKQSYKKKIFSKFKISNFI